MENYSPIELKNNKSVGFTVKCGYYDFFFVPKDKLLLGNSNIYLDGHYYTREYQWYWGKNFYWGVFHNDILIKQIEEVVIEEVSEIPEWVTINYTLVQEEFKAIDKKRYENSLRGKFMSLFKRGKK